MLYAQEQMDASDVEMETNLLNAVVTAAIQFEDYLTNLNRAWR